MRSRRKVCQNGLQKGDLKASHCRFSGAKCKCVCFFGVKFEADSEQLLRSIERFCPTLSLIITVRSIDVKVLKSR